VEIKWLGCHPNNYGKGRNGQRAIAIVNHVALGIEAGTVGWFNNPASGVSSTYFICLDGRVLQFVRHEDTPFTNGNVRLPNISAAPWLRDYPWPHPITANNFCITIEYEGTHRGGKRGSRSYEGRQLAVDLVPGTVTEFWQPTPEQYASALALHWKLVREEGITLDRAHILRHSDFDSVAKWFCPDGKHLQPETPGGFPMARLIGDLQALAREAASPIPPPPTPPESFEFQPYQAPTISPEVFAAWLSARHSPCLVEGGQSFPAAAYYCALVDAGINPALFISMFQKESQCGTAGVVKDFVTRNPGNLRPRKERRRGTGVARTPYGDFIIYPTWMAGVLDFCEVWGLPEYKGKNLREAIRVYAPAGDHENDPDSYYTFIVDMMTKLKQQSGL
jgi:hypothetical protein